MITKLHTCKT